MGRWLLKLSSAFIILLICASGAAYAEDDNAEPVFEPVEIPPLYATPLDQEKPKPTPAKPPETCSYTTWDWDTKKNEITNHVRVNKKYAKLTYEEKHSSGCTICEEDQAVVDVPGAPVFKICRKFAPLIAQAITNAIARGEKIETIVGYRPGRSQGGTNAKGLKTAHGPHSYGAAIDFNSSHNGMYVNCKKGFSKYCTKTMGGIYAPHKDPLSITHDSVLYQAMKDSGWSWGGDWATDLKDFMHFSVDGR